MIARDTKPRSETRHWRPRMGRPSAKPIRWMRRSRWLAAASAAGALTLLHALPAAAQAQGQGRQPRPLVNPPSPSQFIPCATPGQPLLKVPELVAQGGVLRGTILLADRPQRMHLGLNCVPQFVRYLTGLNAMLPGYIGAAPPGYTGYVAPTYVSPSPANQQYPDPIPGPTLRARVGNVVALTFLNQVDPGNYGDSIDRGERGQGCDESSAPYPGDPRQGGDVFPDCFHGSSTGNIHFHGTHTSPSSTGDNVFLEIRPSLRESGLPVVTEASVKAPFEEFFAICEFHLRNNVLSQWPRTWDDLPLSFRASQEALLKAYDSNPAIQNKLWPVNRRQIQAGAWPQYYIGAFPYCFRLPQYTAQTFPPPGTHAGHASVAGDDARVLQMGQSPGTHWYHAHKHGSTTINVANGMTGAFIIEGPYDDELNKFYGSGWTRTQPIMVINQLGVSPRLFGGGAGAPPFVVNGRSQPTVSMQPGEVQMWRIINTSSRSGAFFVGPPAGFQWKQLAQDGVQFSGPNYQGNQNLPFLMAAGNRVDLLVKAPANNTPQAQSYAVNVIDAVRTADTTGGTPQVLLTVQVQPGSPVPPTDNRSQFLPEASMVASFPPFLADIAPEEVRATKTVTFETADPNPPAPSGGAPFRVHTIDGQKFDGNIGQVVLLNKVEEWKIENRTVTPQIDHPFHIHINPFQVVEVFDPNQTVTVGNQVVPKFVFFDNPKPDPTQCYLDPFKPETWKDCHPVAPANIWWDVFPIPSGVGATDANKNPIIDPKTGKQIVVPGYFKMRSRFVDYTGQYVIHCHILAHEDRGMMTIVQVVPYKTEYSHK